VYFLFTFISMPIWYASMKKLGNKYTFIAGIFVQISGFCIAFFVTDFTMAIIMGIVLGLGQGSNSIVSLPVFSDVIDEITLKTKVREEGIYGGIYAFLNRFGILMTPFIIAIIHTITFFNPDADFYTLPLSAKQGIIAMMSWLPAIILLASSVIFTLFYSLTNEKTKENKEKLAELNL